MLPGRYLNGWFPRPQGSAGTGKGSEGHLGSLSVLLTPDTAMPGPWFLLAMALTLTLTSVPGGHAQLEVAQQEGAIAAEHPGLDDLLRQAEHLLLREELQRLREDQGDSESGGQLDCSGLGEERRAPGRVRGNLAPEGRE